MLVPSAAVAWLTADDMGAEYATGVVRTLRPKRPCRHDALDGVTDRGAGDGRFAHSA